MSFAIATTAYTGHAIHVSMPEEGENVIIALPEANLIFTFDPSKTTVARMGDDLVFMGASGARVVINDFFSMDRETLPTLVMPDGVTLTAAGFLEDSGLDSPTAAGPDANGGASGGAGIYADNAGGLLSGVAKLGAVYGDALPVSLTPAYGTDAFGSGLPGGKAVTAAGIPGPGILSGSGSSSGGDQESGSAGGGNPQEEEQGADASPGNGGTAEPGGGQAGAPANGTENDPGRETGDGEGGGTGDGSGFGDVPEGSTGTVAIAEGKLTIQAVIIRIMGEVAEVASDNACLTVDENGLLGISSEISWGEGDAIDGMDGLIIACEGGGTTDQMDIGYTAKTWGGHVHYQLYDAEGHLIGEPVQVLLSGHQPGTEGLLSITVPEGCNGFASVMLFTKGACALALNSVTVSLSEGVSSLEAGTQETEAVFAAAAFTEAAGIHEAAGVAAPGETGDAFWDDFSPLCIGDYGVVTGFSLMSHDWQHLVELSGLEGFFNSTGGFGLREILDADGAAQGRAPDNAGEYALQVVSACGETPAARAESPAPAGGYVEPPRDALEDEATAEVLIKSVIG